MSYAVKANGAGWRAVNGPQDCDADETWQEERPAPAPVDVQEQIISKLSAQIQKHLDDFAATRKYDNVGSLSKYTSLTDTEIASLPQADQAAALRYRSECRHLLLKVAQTWAVGERILGEVLSSQRPTPASIADFAAELPSLDWPV